MTNQEKQTAILEKLGSLQAYNRLLWEKIPPDFYMVMDSQGNITVPDGSIQEYLNREMASGLSYDQIRERDTERFCKITEELYSDVILNAQN
jgi:hypothetical protein